MVTLEFPSRETVEERLGTISSDARAQANAQSRFTVYALGLTHKVLAPSEFYAARDAYMRMSGLGGAERGGV
jgi:hypothetical protein